MNEFKAPQPCLLSYAYSENGDGKPNKLADALSCNHMQVFQGEAPTADQLDSHIPSVLQEMLLPSARTGPHKSGKAGWKLVERGIAPSMV